jgi:hypothetical protein
MCHFPIGSGREPRTVLSHYEKHDNDEERTNQLQNRILESKPAELEQVVRNREGITIEKSADASDEVQYASERA